MNIKKSRVTKKNLPRSGEEGVRHYELRQQIDGNLVLIGMVRQDQALHPESRFSFMPSEFCWMMPFAKKTMKDIITEIERRHPHALPHVL